jgi:hypothetical protein
VHGGAGVDNDQRLRIAPPPPRAPAAPDARRRQQRSGDEHTEGVRGSHYPGKCGWMTTADTGGADGEGEGTGTGNPALARTAGSQLRSSPSTACDVANVLGNDAPFGLAT